MVIIKAEKELTAGVLCVCVYVCQLRNVREMQDLGSTETNCIAGKRNINSLMVTTVSRRVSCFRSFEITLTLVSNLYKYIIMHLLFKNSLHSRAFPRFPINLQK